MPVTKRKENISKGYKEMTITISHSKKAFYEGCSVWCNVCSVCTYYYRCMYMFEEAIVQPWVSFL